MGQRWYSYTHTVYMALVIQQLIHKKISAMPQEPRERCSQARNCCCEPTEGIGLASGLAER